MERLIILNVTTKENESVFNLRYIILVLFFLSYQINICAQESWERINVPTKQFLKAVHFVDSLYGWAVGDSGTIIHTSDGGNNWNNQNSSTFYDIVEVFFLNRNLGWALSWKSDVPPYGTFLLKTSDGGLTWNGQAYREENLFMTCIFFLDSLHGWMGGKPHALVRTTDGGSYWEQALIDTANLAFLPVLSIKFYNAQYGFASGGQIDLAGVTWRTSNGGEIWYSIRPEDATADPIQEIHIVDSINVIGISGDIEGFYGIDVIRTSDGGLYWTYETLTHRWVPLDLDFRSETEVWAPIPSSRKFILSRDAGTTWEEVTTPDSTAIYDLVFPDSLNGFAVGEQGAMLQYHPPVIDNIRGKANLNLGEFALKQNYPNPFNPLTRIGFIISSTFSSFSSSESSEDIFFVTLKVYDIIGDEVKLLVKSELFPGEYEVVFKGNGLPSGIYIYQITMVTPRKVELFTMSKKMILLK